MKYRPFIMVMAVGMTLFLAIAGAFVPGADAEDIDCSMCHPDLAKKKTVHAAVGMGCTGCHASLNAAEMPHKVTGKVPKGLSAGQPDLCYGCHDKAMFTKKNQHAALGMGCTSCHNPHSTDTQKLLTSDLPGLCYGCHDKAKFAGKTVHAPVAGGMCTSCHNPHSSDDPKLMLKVLPDLCFTCHDKGPFSKTNLHVPVAGGICFSCHGPHATNDMALLLKAPVAVCLECHPDMAKKRHVTAEGWHPVGSEATHGDKKVQRKKQLMDPARPGKEYYCGSCHNPHSSDSKSLYRYKAGSIYELCINCHKK